MTDIDEGDDDETDADDVEESLAELDDDDEETVAFSLEGILPILESMSSFIISRRFGPINEFL